jgi:3-demethoxyubiquinol 3-hydroxylase
MSTSRQYTGLDRLLMGLDDLFKATSGPRAGKIRPSPADAVEYWPLADEIQRQSGRLMRVNHAGEVSAQALYVGQATTANDPQVRDIILNSAREEVDHLDWCQRRLDELGAHSSYLNPLWYAGSFSLGALAGLVGDEWSLGFVAETEHQVVRHLDSHLARMPVEDIKSRVILEQMKIDEGKHATVAIESGARQLPGPVKKLMALFSGVMTKTAYWI